MNVSLLLHTLRFLKRRQIAYQLKYRILKSRSVCVGEIQGDRLQISEPIIKYRGLKEGCDFQFLNITSPFTSWNNTANGMLWAYNLNYMDWLLQENAGINEGNYWIDKFIAEQPQNRIGLDPYPIALRGINWIKYITLHYNEIEEDKRQRWNTSLYSQYGLLYKKIEYHLLGNHLLEDAYSLFIAGIYFKDRTFYENAVKLLKKELQEQILPDGAHFEQSPMYHCIMSDRLLDCCNVSFQNLQFDGQKDFNEFLRKKAILMLEHLENIVYSDGTTPLFNDSAKDIAPTPMQLKDYAMRLGLRWHSIELKDCGYRKYENEIFESFLDVGNMTASYQPGHSHADTFNYELRVKGTPFIVDTGISTYNKTKRRQLERSTCAHNTVTVNGHDSSEVWGGFRVGNRAKVTVQEERPMYIKAHHDGFGKNYIHQRTFNMEKSVFHVADVIRHKCEAVNYVHLASNVKVLSYDEERVKTNVATINFEGTSNIKVTEGKYSTGYNQFFPSKIIEMHFEQKMNYTVSVE